MYIKYTRIVILFQVLVSNTDSFTWTQVNSLKYYNLKLVIQFEIIYSFSKLNGYI